MLFFSSSLLHDPPQDKTATSCVVMLLALAFWFFFGEGGLSGLRICGIWEGERVADRGMATSDSGLELWLNNFLFVWCVMCDVMC